MHIARKEAMTDKGRVSRTCLRFTYCRSIITMLMQLTSPGGRPSHWWAIENYSPPHLFSPFNPISPDNAKCLNYWFSAGEESLYDPVACRFKKVEGHMPPPGLMIQVLVDVITECWTVTPVSAGHGESNIRSASDQINKCVSKTQIPPYGAPRSKFTKLGEAHAGW